MQLTSATVVRVGPDDDPAQVRAGTPLVSVDRADVDPPHDYLVGIFRHADGRRAVLQHRDDLRGSTAKDLNQWCSEAS